MGDGSWRNIHLPWITQRSSRNTHRGYLVQSIWLMRHYKLTWWSDSNFSFVSFSIAKASSMAAKNQNMRFREASAIWEQTECDKQLRHVPNMLNDASHKCWKWRAYSKEHPLSQHGQTPSLATRWCSALLFLHACSITTCDTIRQNNELQLNNHSVVGRKMIKSISSILVRTIPRKLKSTPKIRDFPAFSSIQFLTSQTK